MNNVGTLTLKHDENNRPILVGEICTYSLRLPIKLENNLLMRTDGSPSHHVFGKSPVHGGLFPAGAAWKGKTQNGEDYLSIELNVPEIMQQPMRLVAWKNDKGDFDVQISTEKKQAA